MIVGRTINYNRLRNPVAAHRARALRAIIAQLFGNGEQGAMYVPQPTLLGEQVLYQDAAGTVPVTADGDPVGYMQDLSGNGNHATQGTSAARPIYRTDGTLHWLQGDGTDDYMTLGDVFNLGTEGLFQTYSHNVTNPTLGGKSWAAPAGGRYFIAWAPTNVLLRGELDTNNYDLAVEPTTGQPSVTSQVITRGASGEHSMRRDGNVAASKAFTTSYDFQSPGRPFWLFAYPNSDSTLVFSGYVMNGDWYGGVVRTGSFTVDQVNSAEQYLAKLAGITL